MSAIAVIVGKVAGRTVIVLETELKPLPQRSVAVQVSVREPPQTPGVVVKVDKSELPEILQLPETPLLKLKVLAAGMLPQSTVISDGAVIVGNAAALTVIVLDTEVIVLPKGSVADQVSVTLPPHASGIDENDELADPLIRQLPLMAF